MRTITCQLLAISILMTSCGPLKSEAPKGVDLPTDPIARAKTCLKATIALGDGRQITDKQKFAALDENMQSQISNIAALAENSSTMTVQGDQKLHVVDRAHLLAGQARDELNAEGATRTPTENTVTGASHLQATLDACHSAFPETAEDHPIKLPENKEVALLQCYALARNGTGENTDFITRNGPRIFSMGTPAKDIQAIAKEYKIDPSWAVDVYLYKLVAQSAKIGRPDRVMSACVSSFK